jgi:hypothetical protein
MKKNDLLTILIPMLFCVIAWIIFNVYHSAVAPTISEIQINEVSAISPNFDTATITILKKRTFIESNIQNNTFINTQTINPPIESTIQDSSKSAKITNGGKLK